MGDVVSNATLASDGSYTFNTEGLAANTPYTIDVAYTPYNSGTALETNFTFTTSAAVIPHLSGMFFESEGYIRVFWNEPDATRFILYRSVSGATNLLAVITNKASTFYDDSDVTNGGTYTYTAFSVNSRGATNTTGTTHTVSVAGLAVAATETNVTTQAVYTTTDTALPLETRVVSASDILAGDTLLIRITDVAGTLVYEKRYTQGLQTIPYGTFAQWDFTSMYTGVKVQQGVYFLHCRIEKADGTLVKDAKQIMVVVQ